MFCFSTGVQNSGVSRRISRQLFGMVCLASVTILGACSSGGGPQQRALRGTPVPAFEVDACSLLSDEEAEAILGVPIAEENSFDNDTSCAYVGDADGGQRLLTVVVRRGEVLGDSARGFDRYKGDAPTVDIGDRAFLRSNEVGVMKGETWLHIFTSSEEPPEDAMTNAARKAVDRL